MESRSALRRGCQPERRKTCTAVVVLAVIIGCVFLAYTAFGDKPKDISLKKVFVVFRHGDRNPTETYPNDPYLHYDWPDGWGALTKKGMRQMYTLGQWISKEFGWITEHKYAGASTIVNSSYSDRCIMSTQALLAGLYPPAEKDTFVPGLPWRPIPVHYVPRGMDKILVVGKSCPRLENALKEAYYNESLRSDKYLKSYYEALTNITGQPMKTITDVEFLYNTLEIEVMNGLELPPAIRKYYNSEMREIAARSYTLFTSNKLQQRLRGGPLLKHILQHMKNGSTNEKLHLYGTHDVNIVNTLRAMGFVDELFKLDLGVSLVYELRVIDGGQSQEVRISMLNNTETTTLYKLRIPGCEDSCKLDDLFQIWKDVIPDNWENECQL
ncbi:lysosomal acid phosphatase [Nasonia vitripennis]|uniref:Lysosomal acid phosphatase n=1 Tax=Nasonia vitripennis TaxID=7425 RepID=A0A7M7QCY4_NASVI|nr:lysosomal acid phosphatase [Nasonia vitripennis]XP_031784606.1 lysosomal acid phosphatase [Nasonia vitripennis]